MKMGLQDLYIISAILGIAVVTVLTRLLFRSSHQSISTENATSGFPSLSLDKESDESSDDHPNPQPNSNITVGFSESGKEFPWDPSKECLFDFIKSKGIEVECMCGAGECGSCRTRVVKGEVRYLKTPKVNPGRGFCLLCITVPKTDLVLDR
jgi:ferredoxin